MQEIKKGSYKLRCCKHLSELFFLLNMLNNIIFIFWLTLRTWTQVCWYLKKAVKFLDCRARYDIESMSTGLHVNTLKNNFPSLKCKLYKKIIKIKYNLRTMTEFTCIFKINIFYNYKYLYLLSKLKNPVKFASRCEWKFCIIFPKTARG